MKIMGTTTGTAIIKNAGKKRMYVQLLSGKRRAIPAGRSAQVKTKIVRGTAKFTDFALLTS